ncbi:AmiR/NasT family two-component response regulator [Rhizobium sp. PP-F2F-G38]|uniref:ANTAR domain-containing protein n=1 Tax=Ferranicluibacter rubi TaxID=2715133 RepID=A0AA43ZFH1_9HYPH|nr:ANTAR domain-containing protein [Ferranicluibacter rubi]PYE32261.1 AmiR/NasT family two-component response regulator [Rhizobium sp. PP-WC-1G-195]PYE94955.1 AmiR/NasT family two-component response regulator [Rhizobium sp. PP-F2F-G38]TCP82146.1 AmiR/NasT family two-component response regulator [Rhizobium sp. PP-CC-2G-626]TCQ03153.1 AmiR/NasT family two-component response regulator [Rhizobium sp. PP-F2F-G36]TCQ25867.1 AmiR/NasT family two-component response regulator [Rhizobium sp. PP-CC-3G-46
MTRRNRPPLAQWRAVILHRDHPSVDALRRQLELLQIRVTVCWPHLDEAQAVADVVFFDADMGHDGQFPWPRGFAPMPMIALIGSEAPGRIEWALDQGSNAHLLKPIGSTGAYSALLIASHAYEQVRAQADNIRVLEDRLRQRPIVVRAILHLLQNEGGGEAAAWKRLRSVAMDWGMTIEDAAEAICRNDKHTRSGA